ncbi:hypothetical protein [Amnibacterium kyonggiense]
MDFGYRTVLLRPRASQALAALVIAICAVGVGGFALRDDLPSLVRAVPPLGLVAVGAWALFWRPSVLLEPARLRLVNPLRTVTITWPAVEDIEDRWNLVVTAGGRRHGAWAAPRTGAIASGRARRAAYGRAADAASGARAGTDAAQGSLAGALAARQWREYRDRGLLGAVEGEGVTTRWHTRTIAALLLLAVASALAVVLL